jgi:hypothetical protein
MDGQDVDIVINGRRLTASQVITIRVALDVFAQRLGIAERDEKRGQTMAEGFRCQLDELLAGIRAEK